MNLERENAIRKAHLYRLLINILDNPQLAPNLYFKGGTCAAMLGFLDRFSVDLDFDLSPTADKQAMRNELYKVFDELGFSIKDESDRALQFFLKYESLPNRRNTLKVEILDKFLEANVYKPQFLPAIDRIANCQTIETMFANKMVAVIDRHEQNGSLAGRDIYDIHHYFLKGYGYEEAVIHERRQVRAGVFLKQLASFIREKITDTIIQQDLNVLLPPATFQKIRSTLKMEVLMFLEGEIKRVQSLQ